MGRHLRRWSSRKGISNGTHPRQKCRGWQWWGEEGQYTWRVWAQGSEETPTSNPDLLQANPKPLGVSEAKDPEPPSK